jgi:hypothetical protein
MLQMRNFRHCKSAAETAVKTLSAIINEGVPIFLYIAMTLSLKQRDPNSTERLNFLMETLTTIVTSTAEFYEIHK